MIARVNHEWSRQAATSCSLPQPIMGNLLASLRFPLAKTSGKHYVKRLKRRGLGGTRTHILPITNRVLSPVRAPVQLPAPKGGTRSDPCRGHVLHDSHSPLLVAHITLTPASHRRGSSFPPIVERRTTSAPPDGHVRQGKGGKASFRSSSHEASCGAQLRRARAPRPP